MSTSQGRASLHIAAHQSQLEAIDFLLSTSNFKNILATKHGDYMGPNDKFWTIIGTLTERHMS